jgi:hypothetical protein
MTNTSYLRAELDRREGRDPGPAAVTLTDLALARYALSAPLYQRGGLALEHFSPSDPRHESFAGRLQAELQRERAERDGAFE